MTLLEHGQPADATTKKRHTGLIALLAVLAVTLLAAGAWLIFDRQQQPLTVEQPLSLTEQPPTFTEQPLLPAEQQQAAIMDVVTAYNDAINAHDADAIRATLADDFAWGGNGYVSADVRAGGMSFGIEEAFIGDPVVSGDLQVTIPTPRVTDGRDTDGTYTFTLPRPRGGSESVALPRLMLAC